jgi:hypothetical protein
MRAGFERDVHRRSKGRVICSCAGPAQGFDFGMRPSARLRPAAADNHAILDDHRADRGVWPGAAQAATPERESKRHETLIVRHGIRHGVILHAHRHANGRAHSAASSPDNSASAASKSLASRKLR